MGSMIRVLFVNEPRRRAPGDGARVALLAAALLSVPSIVAAASLGQSRASSEEAPLFEQTASNVSGFEGQSVYLPCRVRNLGDKVVSWMRSRDLHILSSGDFSFSSDPRFKPQHLEGSDAWTLRLERLRSSDAGRYECQVNTEPKIMYSVHLAVRELDQAGGRDEPHSQQSRISYESTAPVAAIMGPRELHVQPGSTVTIRCVVTSPYQTRPLRAVQWLRDGKLLTFQAARGGISVETVSAMAQTLSEATLSNVSRGDAGKYSCRPPEGKLDTILLHVQHTAEAMQRDPAATSGSDCGRRCCRLLLLLLLPLALARALPRSAAGARASPRTMTESRVDIVKNG